MEEFLNQKDDMSYDTIPFLHICSGDRVRFSSFYLVRKWILNLSLASTKPLIYGRGFVAFLGNSLDEFAADIKSLLEIRFTNNIIKLTVKIKL